MIVSERATGRHTRPTLLLAGLLAAVSIPAWSFNQTQAEEVTKVQAKRAAAADKAKQAEIELELLAHMAMLDEKHAVLPEQARGGANPEALAELQDARDMLQAKIEALQADHAVLTDDRRKKYVEADAAAMEKRKVDVHQRLAALELKRAALLQQTAGNPDPADLASLEEARVLLIEKMHAEMTALDHDAKGKYKARAKKPPPVDAETMKRQAVKELLDEIMSSDAAKSKRAAEEAATADDLKARMLNAEAHADLLHRYFLGLDKKKRVEGAGAADAAAADREEMHRYYKALGRHDLAEAALTENAAAAHKELLRRSLVELGRYAEAEAMRNDEGAAAADADLLKKRHLEMLKSYKKARAEEAAAAGQALTDAERAKLEAHARMLKKELARKAEADAKTESVKPEN